MLTEILKVTSYFHAGLYLNEYPVFAPLTCIWGRATSFTASMFSVLTFPTAAKYACWRQVLGTAIKTYDFL